MGATLEQIEAALLAPFTGGAWTATDVAYENVDYVPTPDTPWVYVETSAGRFIRVGVSNVEIGDPELTIHVHVPLGWGKSAARALLDTAVAMYRDKLILVGSGSMLPYSFSRPVELPANGWYKLAQQVNFRFV